MMYAQTPADSTKKAWKFDGIIGLNGAATGLLNWTAGGNNNANGLAFAKLHLLYKNEVVEWETNFDTDFGMTWINQSEDQWQKSSDNIKLATKFGWKFYEGFFLTALGSFQSQYALGREYAPGFNNPISKWLAPSYTDISLGIDWKKSVSGCDFSLYFSPVAGRITTAYVSDAMNQKYTNEHTAARIAGDLPDEDNWIDFRTELQLKYGTFQLKQDDMGNVSVIMRDYRAEFGMSFKGAFTYNYKGLKLGTTLGLFTPYQGKGFPITHVIPYYTYSNLDRYFGRFDVDWDLSVSYQFLKVLNLTFSTNLKFYPGSLYEDGDSVVKEPLQIKSVLGVGLGYSF